MKDIALWACPAAALAAFVVAFIRTFRPVEATASTEGEQ